ncbi:hypothetical protein DPMN_160292 [Dreissena polymorpha]|uniref:Uncharacterized protein n=1 Tax=Dreissena polymorpha TaxID=45954 RepID=A0A9D4IRJ6_DREPO|nr:hypothetical protein DPMN_160292 [Dreissena polymorpha]
MLSKQSEVKDQFLQEFTVILEYMEWKKIRPLKGTHTLVKGSGWPSLLAEKFNQMIPGCVLSFKNHTVYNGSRGGYFRANAHCKHEGCGAFVFSMRKKPPKHSSAQILVTVTHPYTRHSRMAIKKRRLQGQQRKETQKRLRMSNPSKLFYEQLGSMDRKQFSSGNYTQSQSKEVLRQAKSEWNLAEIEHKDPFTELCIVASTLADCLPGKSNSLNLRGYVQTISYQPFSTILFSYESLMAAKNNIQNADGTFYFDATGGVAFLAGKSRRKLLYYALVQKGLNNSVVPVLQFLLENQTTVAIVNPLLLFFTALKKCTKHCSPKRVEMDFSWAIIHSVLQVLNCTTIHVYIKYCYMLITAKISADTDTTVIHICSAHMVKTCRDYLRDKVPNKVIRQNAIKAFSLLQNCT